ncbi:MAG: hypothetical protein MK085_08670 [Phycisphaerales bacterium]|nr:hypothetical protein [Phycisphaerales bacterium]
MRHVLGCLLLVGLAGCTQAPRATHSNIAPGARQDSNYEIKGKPQGAEQQSGEISGVGYNNKGGEINAQVAEQDAAGQVHYHYHTHVYAPPGPAGSSSEVAGLPQGAGQGVHAPGYVQPSYSVQQHASSMNPYATPYSVVRSPYAASPNAGNPAKLAYPYRTNIYGSSNNMYYGRGGGWGVGSLGWGSGGVNFN